MPVPSAPDGAGEVGDGSESWAAPDVHASAGESRRVYLPAAAVSSALAMLSYCAARSWFSFAI